MEGHRLAQSAGETAGRLAVVEFQQFCLDKATVAACPISIDHVRLPVGHGACENPTVRTALTVACIYPLQLMD